MWDALYVLITLAFFAAMLWYVAGCKWLGGRAEGDDEVEQSTSNSRRGRTLP
jgi:hypothetical protein